MATNVQTTQPPRTAACLDVKAGNTIFKKRWCWLDVDYISWGKDPEKPKHKVLLSNLKVEVNNNILVVTDPRMSGDQHLCVSVSEADTTSVSFLQEIRKRRGLQEGSSGDTESRMAKSFAKVDETEDESLKSRAQEPSSDEQSNMGNTTSETQPVPFSAPLPSPRSKRYLSTSPSSSQMVTFATLEGDLNPPSKTSPITERYARVTNWKRLDKPAGNLILPGEILLKVLRFVPWNDILMSVALVSRDWLNVTRSESLWKKIYRDAYGTFYDNSVLFEERTTWPERFLSTNMVETNWKAAKYRKKETLYVSLRTVRKLLWSQKALALIYGNTIDFMDAQKRRIFSRFSPEAPYIRGVDICGDLIACSTNENWNHVTVQRRGPMLQPDLREPEVSSWKADSDVIDVVAFPSFCQKTGKAPDRLMTGAKKCMLWDLETRKLIHSIGMQNQGSVNVLQFDDNKAICSHRGSKIRIWDLRSGKRTFVLKGHSNLIHCFTYDEDVVVSGSKDCDLRVWACQDARKNYACRSVLEGHKTSVRALGMSRWLVSGSKDEIRIWDVNNVDRQGKATGRIPLHDPVFALTFDETHLYVGSGTLKVYDFSEKRTRGKMNFLRKIF